MQFDNARRVSVSIHLRWMIEASIRYHFFLNSAWWELTTVSTLPYTPKLTSKCKYRVTCNSLINVTIESHQTHIPTTHIWNRNHPTPNAISYRLVVHKYIPGIMQPVRAWLSFYCVYVRGAYIGVRCLIGSKSDLISDDIQTMTMMIKCWFP